MGVRRHDGYAGFAPRFFERTDERDDAQFYGPDRFVQHIDDGAIGAVGLLYDQLSVAGDVLDLMSSWVSHFDAKPERLTVLGMNRAELEANPMADKVVVRDLNQSPRLPFDDRSFDDAVCAVSVDYLTQPLEVFVEVARVLRPGGRFICTFSNRCFPTKAIAGWLHADSQQRCEIVATYFGGTDGFGEPTIADRSPSSFGDPLYGVWASTPSQPGGQTG